MRRRWKKEREKKSNRKRGVKINGQTLEFKS